jgi:hypothetical protein
MATELKVFELKINLSTIIPGQKLIRFNRGMLYHPDSNLSNIELSNYPWFTYQAHYPIDKISGSYNSIIDFFFNRDRFEEIMKEEEIIDLTPGKEEIEINEIIDHNIMIMLFLLFPTRYPVINDIKNSYDIYRGVDSLKTLFFNPLKRAPFTYLKLGSDVYTVQKVVWLNDIINHPKYQRFLFNRRASVPNNKSTNPFLQITSSNLNDQREVIKKCYLEGCDDSRERLYVGLDSVNDSFELFLMVDLIKGELTNDNINSVFCPMFGEITGNKLLEIIDNIKSKKTINANRVDLNRYMFSIGDEKMIPAESKDENKEKDVLAKRAEQEEKEYNEINDDIKNNFNDVFNELENNPEFESILKENRGKITNKTLLIYLKKKYRDLLPIFKLFGTNNAVHYETYTKTLSRMSNEIESLKGRLRVTTSDDEDIAYSYALSNTTLLRMIIEELSKKVESQIANTTGKRRGGSRKNKLHKKKRTLKYSKKDRD